jgi:hypothetical protein
MHTHLSWISLIHFAGFRDSLIIVLSNGFSTGGFIAVFLNLAIPFDSTTKPDHADPSLRFLLSLFALEPLCCSHSISNDHFHYLLLALNISFVGFCFFFSSLALTKPSLPPIRLHCFVVVLPFHGAGTPILSEINLVEDKKTVLHVSIKFNAHVKLKNTSWLILTYVSDRCQFL